MNGIVWLAFVLIGLLSLVAGAYSDDGFTALAGVVLASAFWIMATIGAVANRVQDQLFDLTAQHAEAMRRLQQEALGGASPDSRRVDPSPSPLSPEDPSDRPTTAVPPPPTLS